MPVYAADVLPDTTGRNLGSPPQRWNIFLQNLDVQGSVNWQPVSGANVGPSGVLYVATSSLNAGTNTTAQQPLMSSVIPAGLLNAPGKVLRGTMGGTYTTQPGQTPGLQITVDLGTVPVFGVGTGARVAGQNNCKWRIQWEFMVLVPGSSGQINPSGIMLSQITMGNNTAESLISLDTLAGPVDLTMAQNLAVQCLFTTNSSPANICVQDQFILEVLN